MERFKNIVSTLCPMDIPNVDTDQIIPKQFLKRIERTGFGQFLFYNWRFDNQGKEKTDFILNKPIYKEAKILLARDNFGCGSSREHAPWALLDHGFKVIIAPSFADIFYNNCFQNGILPIILDSNKVSSLFEQAFETPQATYEVDLEKTTITNQQTGEVISFKIDPAKQEKLLKGIDDIGLTLQFNKEITEYEKVNNSQVKLPV